MVTLATFEDLEKWKCEIVQEVSDIVKGNIPQPKKWVKSIEAKEMLGCSPGTLQNLRQTSKIEWSRVGGTLYYSMESILKTLESNKINAA